MMIAGIPGCNLFRGDGFLISGNGGRGHVDAAGVVNPGIDQAAGAVRAEDEILAGMQHGRTLRGRNCRGHRSYCLNIAVQVTDIIGSNSLGLGTDDLGSDVDRGLQVGKSGGRHLHYGDIGRGELGHRGGGE